jgi:excisionase family DNA binding protein
MTKVLPRMSNQNNDDRLLTPREMAQLFNVRTTTVARWETEGHIDALFTPGGHRRYRLSDALALKKANEEPALDKYSDIAEDAVRLYNEGWNIRQVASRFNLSYITMHRILERNNVRFRKQSSG